MKILELLQEETLDQYTAKLVKTLNIKKLGRGMYASVFQHPVYHNVAVKVVQDDPAYMYFAKFCMKNPDNQWLPKIVSIHAVDFDGRRKSSHIIFFQKLRPARRSEIKAAMQQIFKTIPIKYFAQDAQDAQDDPLFKPMAHYDDFQDLDGHWRHIANKTTDDDVRVVAKYFANLNGVDLHHNNVMMRDDRGRAQLVFTDPVAS
jgi:hypothetical protein